MTQELVPRQRIGDISVITLDNLRRRNALSHEVLSALKARLDEARDDTGVHVVVLRAEGPAFSSGHDLTELIEGDREAYAEIFDLCTEVMETIRLLPQPVIAQVRGLATAAGCQLVATCDMVIASEEASFATPGVQIGLFCTTPGVALARAVPPKKAMEMLLTGTPISARDALASGLVNRVVPVDDLEEETMSLARRVASYSPSVMALGKAAFYKQLTMDRPEAYRFAERVMVGNLMSPNASEGIGAFLEKRDAKWVS